MAWCKLEALCGQRGLVNSSVKMAAACQAPWIDGARGEIDEKRIHNKHHINLINQPCAEQRGQWCPHRHTHTDVAGGGQQKKLPRKAEHLDSQAITRKSAGLCLFERMCVCVCRVE